jgi:hypothetical protein
MRMRWMAMIIGAGLMGLPTVSLGQSPVAAAVSRADPLLAQLARRYTTPKAIAAFLHREFTFRRDEELFGEEDHWQRPEEFAAGRIGDCEDYALLAQALLQRNGYEAYVLSLFGEEGYAHTVAVYRDERGRYNAINQDDLRAYRAKSLEALASDLNPGWTIAMVAEQDGTRGRAVRQIANPSPAPSLDDLPPAF